MNTAQKASPVHQPAPTSTPELKSIDEQEARKETAHGLAADLIERALQGEVSSLFITLLQIADSGLIDKQDVFRRGLDDLCRRGETLTSRLHKHYPASSSGGARHLLEKCKTLAEEVNLYRQEQFWLRDGPAALIESEQLISDIYSFYYDAEFLMRSIDQEQPDYRVESRYSVPQRTPNPYESIDHD
jgi:hypothetical protein